MLINDSIFHMDDAIKNLSTIKAAQVTEQEIFHVVLLSEYCCVCGYRIG